MIKLLDIIACGLITGFQLVKVLAIIILVQMISYKVFNVNLYKLFTKGLIKLERRMNGYV